MNKQLNDQVKELVNHGVYDIVDKSTDLYVRLGKIQDTMNRVEIGGAKLKETLDSKNWIMVIESRQNTILRVGSDDVLSPLILETLKQLMDLLEAIHYSERKAAIILFNNTLKKTDDERSSEK